MQCNMKHTFGQWLFLHFIWITWNKRSFMIPMLCNIFSNILACQSCNTPWNKSNKNQRNSAQNISFSIMVIFIKFLLLHHIPFTCFCLIKFSMLPFLHHSNLFFLPCWCFPFLKCLLVITFQFFWFSKYS